jgi:predicted amino acid dehydrogenase
LTIGMGIEAIVQACLARGRRLEQETAVVVGAAGNIASTYAALLSERVGRLWLLGSERDGSRRRLEHAAALIHAGAAHNLLEGRIEHDLLARRLSGLDGVAELLAEHADSADLGLRLYRHVGERMGSEAWVRVADDFACIGQAGIVVCAANAPQAFLDASHFAADAIVCDIAVPLNVEAGTAVQRPDLAYMHGGIVSTPLGDSLPAHVRAYLGEGQLYACMAESVLMGLCGMRQHYSHGDVSRDQVRQIMALAHAHGFRLAAAKTGSSL